MTEQVDNNSHKESEVWYQIITFFTIFIMFELFLFSFFMRQSLFKLGIYAGIRVQQNFNNESILKATNIISQYCGHTLGIIPLILFLQFVFSKQKLRSVVHVTYYIFINYFWYVLKALYQDPRPAWYTDDILLLDKHPDKTFGNPSSHMMTVFVLYEPFLSDCLNLNKKNSTLITFFLAILIAFTRLLLSDHSLDQILLGSNLGLVFVVLYHYKLKQLLYLFYIGLLVKKERIKSFVLLVLSIILLLGVPLLAYEVNISHRPVAEYYLRRLSTFYHRKITHQDMEKSFIHDEALIGLFYGIVISFVILAHLKKKKMYFNYMVGEWKYSSIVIAIILYVFHLGIAYLLGKFIKIHLKHIIKNMLVCYFVTFVGYIILGVVFVFLFTFVSEQLQFIQEKSEKLIEEDQNND